jgi:transposase
MSGAPWSTAESKRLRALATAGLSVLEIANEMRRSNNAIRTWAKKLNIGIAKSRQPGQLQVKFEAARLQHIKAKIKKAQC